MINFFKGIIIGAAKIMPGVSGSVLAISLGVYSNCINILNRFYKMTKKEFVYIFPIIIGVLCGILGFSLVLSSVYHKYYFATILLFTGFIIGDIYKDISVNLKKDIPFYLIVLFIIFCLPFFNIKGLNIENEYLLFTVLGMIESFTMIIPGISGTAILISLNLYDTYLNFIVSLANPSFLFSHLDILIIYSLSLIVFGFITIKMIAYLFSKLKCFNSIIRSLLIISIIVMVKKVIPDVSGFTDVLYGIGISFIGFLISYILGKVLSNKNKSI